MTDNGTKRIVVGVDGSTSSRDALRWAIGQAMLTGAVVEAVMAWHVPVTDGWAPMFDLVEDLTKASERTLANTITEVAGDSCPVTVEQRVIEGAPAQVLLSAARGADLLVVGSRGHGGVAGALLGSVSQYCVHHAPCPVVVIRGEHR
jgi:nucleotide-binding universal stress UspA family protein